MCPITPHFSEHIWTEILKKEFLCVKSKWPKLSNKIDLSLQRKFTVLKNNLRDFRVDLLKFSNSGKKQKTSTSTPSGCIIYVAKVILQFKYSNF